MVPTDASPAPGRACYNTALRSPPCLGASRSGERPTVCISDKFQWLLVLLAHTLRTTDLDHDLQDKCPPQPLGLTSHLNKSPEPPLPLVLDEKSYDRMFWSHLGPTLRCCLCLVIKTLWPMAAQKPLVT